MLTGTSKTVARSLAVFSSSGSAAGTPSAPSNSCRLRPAAASASVSLSSAMIGLALRNQGFGVQAFGRQRRGKGFGDTGGSLFGIECRATIAPVEYEGGHRQGGVALDHDGAGETDRLGGLVEGL